MVRVLAVNVMLLLGSGLVSGAAAQEPEPIGDFFFVASADPFEDDDRSMVATIEIRITSYNVCYTKLLRAESTGCAGEGSTAGYLCDSCGRCSGTYRVPDQYRESVWGSPRQAGGPA